VIEARAIRLKQGGRVLLDDFSWRLPDPGVYLLAGGIGSGKSVLCRLLTGRMRPQRGQVLIDAEPLYRWWGGYSEPVFYAAAELQTRESESLHDYLSAELAAAGAARSALAPLLDRLLTVLPASGDTPLNQLSHGAVLLAQVALAAALPVRLAVLDGHLTYLDQHFCAAANQLLKPVAQEQDRFVLLATARLADGFPAARETFVLNGNLPIELSPLAAGQALDTRLNVVIDKTALRVYFANRQPPAGISSGKHYMVQTRLESGLRIKLTGRLDDALQELRNQGLSIIRVEWEADYSSPLSVSPSSSETAPLT